MQIIEKYFEYCFDCKPSRMDKNWFDKFYLLISNWR